MTYVVTDACIKCKYMDCVEVCPVDCFYEGENMLVINPNECIDCGVCEPECPAEAILPDTENGQEKWLELNATFSSQWPNLTRKKDSPADADGQRVALVVGVGQGGCDGIGLREGGRGDGHQGGGGKQSGLHESIPQWPRSDAAFGRDSACMTTHS